MPCMSAQGQGCRRGRRRSGPALRLLLCAVGVMGAPTSVVAQQRAPVPATVSVPDSGATAVFVPGVPVARTGGGGSHPAFRTSREVALISLGSTALLAGVLTPLDAPDVPPAGFDPADLRWSLDRRAVRSPRPGAMIWSDVTDAAATILPLAVAGIRSTGTYRWETLGRTAALQAEVLLVAQGTVLLTKRLVARPRPCTYLPEAVRLVAGHCDLSRTRTFQSMPSGHASSAWAMATLTLTEQLLSRPDAEWMEHASVGALGGLLATTTSGLRIAAGEHFASDVLLGSGIGILTGVTLPILHRGERSWPSWAAVLQGAGGLMVGSVAGAIVVQLF